MMRIFVYDNSYDIACDIWSNMLNQEFFLSYKTITFDFFQVKMLKLC
jgi:hypothetical protein